MKKYTTQLQAGLGLIEENKKLFELWSPGLKSSELYKIALESGNFSNVTARRLLNIVSECFAPRFLGKNEYPVKIIKSLINKLNNQELKQILFLYTARANLILYDFVKEVYWSKYSGGYEIINSDDAKDFVIKANQNDKTTRYWSESTVKRVSGYLNGCCSDFGLLESGSKSTRKILPFRIEAKMVAILAYDLHFSGLGDNAIVNHPDWQLFGLQPDDVKNELKRLSLKNLLIIQIAGDVTRISWNYKNWEGLINVIS